ncbi:MAG: protease pro-enzyme activation domain-containing protein, partial [Thermoplasmata archaeon]
MHPSVLLVRTRSPSTWAAGIAVAVALLMLLPAPPLAGSPTSLQMPLTGTVLGSGPRISVPTLVDGPVPSSGGSPMRGNVSVFVAFRLQNQTALNELLAVLANPASPEYRHYLTAGEFLQEFSPSATTYRAAVEYFSQVPGLAVSTYRDRVGLMIHGPATAVEQAFGVSLERFAPSGGASSFMAPVGSATLPEPLGLQVLQVTGLDSRPVAQSDLRIGEHAPVAGEGTVVSSAAYPAPSSCYTGAQCLWGSDLQVAYDERALFNVTYPTHEVVATIL